MKNLKKKIFETIKNEDGWTFMETLIVIAIILVLSATAGFAAINSLEKSRIAAAKTQIESLATALEAYYIDCGNYPAAEQGLAALRKKPETSPSSDSWGGPYLYKDAPKDPWGYEYEYTCPAPDGSPYGIRSFGADGMEGGEGKNADIKSWE
ncbi:type II secretion system major pseudopilin GspG [uncultured Treponema sp.]|uniref:type II secretion system major pseudopilin GspG n=1 Tax=uncultured Treponema sp. TaxID=162155 RepID=UPI0034571E4F